jgi:hypothetical protein
MHHFNDILFTDQTHPKIISALNSHASYLYDGTNRSIPNQMPVFPYAALISALNEISIDLVGTDINGPALIYEHPHPLPSSYKLWEAHAFDMSDFSKLPDWLLYRGRWGGDTNQTQIQIPPIGVPYRFILYRTLQVILLTSLFSLLSSLSLLLSLSFSIALSLSFSIAFSLPLSLLLPAISVSLSLSLYLSISFSFSLSPTI